MTTRLTIDGAGRVMLPKSLRKKLNLGEGDVLKLERSGEKITLRPIRNKTPLTKEKGIWVFHTGQPMPESIVRNVMKQTRR